MSNIFWKETKSSTVQIEIYQKIASLLRHDNWHTHFLIQRNFKNEIKKAWHLMQNILLYNNNKRRQTRREKSRQKIQCKENFQNKKIFICWLYTFCIKKKKHWNCSFTEDVSNMRVFTWNVITGLNGGTTIV